MKKRTKLKPRPFCGSEADVVFSGTGFAYCLNCGVASGMAETREQVVAKWNSRATEEDALRREGAVAALRDLCARAERRGGYDYGWVAAFADRIAGGEVTPWK